MLFVGAPFGAAPKYAVCQGSVCTKHGSALVLEAAEGLACSTEGVDVVGKSCLGACRGGRLEGGIATFVSSTRSSVILERCDEPCAALTQARTAIVRDVGVAPAELFGAALESKLEGDRAAANGEAGAARAAYSAALAALGKLQRESCGAAALASGADMSAWAAALAGGAAALASAPPTHTGLPPSRLAAARAKERARVTPGRVRWAFEALVGRCRASIALASRDSTLEDARDAIALCPLAPGGWEALRDAAEAEGGIGGAALRSQAAAAAEARRPR